MLVSGPLCDPQILVANDKACQLLGHSSHDLIGQKLTQFFLEPDSDVVKALSEEHVEADGRAAVVFGTVVSAPSRGVPLGARRRYGRSLVTVAAVLPRCWCGEQLGWGQSVPGAEGGGCGPGVRGGPACEGGSSGGGLQTGRMPRGVP